MASESQAERPCVGGPLIEDHFKRLMFEEEKG